MCFTDSALWMVSVGTGIALLLADERGWKHTVGMRIASLRFGSRYYCSGLVVSSVCTPSTWSCFLFTAHFPHFSLSRFFCEAYSWPAEFIEIEVQCCWFFSCFKILKNSELSHFNALASHAFQLHWKWTLLYYIKRLPGIYKNWRNFWTQKRRLIRDAILNISLFNLKLKRRENSLAV